MGIWEDEWMQYISGLDQEEANQTVIRSAYYYSHFNQSEVSIPPSDVYPYSSKLTVVNVYNGQHAVLLLCTSSTSCQLLTTIFLYSTQFCLFFISLLFIGYLALVVLCLMACRHSYDHFFDGDQKKMKGKAGRGCLTAEERRCPHCNCQRGLIIQVNRGLSQSPPAPLQSQPAQFDLPQVNGAQDDLMLVTAEVPSNKNGNQISEQFLQGPAEVVEGEEMLAMHFTSHIPFLKSIYDCKEDFGDDMKTETSSLNSGYLSDLLPPLSFTSTNTFSTSNTSVSLKKKKEHSILYFPLSKHDQSTFSQPSADSGGDKVGHKNDCQTNGDSKFVVAEKDVDLPEDSPLSSKIPLPSHKVSSFMMLNRFAHEISQNESGDTLIQK